MADGAVEEESFSTPPCARPLLQWGSFDLGEGACGATDQGRSRRDQEDAFAYASTENGRTRVFVVADGHGGSAVATLLRDQYAADALARIRAGSSAEAAVVDTAFDMQSICVAEGMPSGACAVIMVLEGAEGGRRGVIGVVGDCAAFGLTRGGACVRLTRDQTPETEHDRLEALGAWFGFGRVNGILAVGNAFGDIHMCRRNVVDHDGAVAVELTSEPLLYAPPTLVSFDAAEYQCVALVSDGCTAAEKYTPEGATEAIVGAIAAAADGAALLEACKVFGELSGDNATVVRVAFAQP